VSYINANLAQHRVAGSYLENLLPITQGQEELVAKFKRRPHSFAALLLPEHPDTAAAVIHDQVRQLNPLDAIWTLVLVREAYLLSVAPVDSLLPLVGRLDSVLNLLECRIRRACVSSQFADVSNQVSYLLDFGTKISRRSSSNLNQASNTGQDSEKRARILKALMVMRESKDRISSSSSNASLPSWNSAWMMISVCVVILLLALFPPVPKRTSKPRSPILPETLTSFDGDVIPLIGWAMESVDALIQSHALSTGLVLLDVSLETLEEDAIKLRKLSPGLQRAQFLLYLRIPIVSCEATVLVKQINDFVMFSRAEYIDLLLLEFPFCRNGDKLVWGLNKLWQTLIEARHKGLTRRIGIGNCNFGTISHLLDSESFPDFVEIESHPYLPQEKLIQWLHTSNVTVFTKLIESVLNALDHQLVVKEVLDQYSLGNSELLVYLNTKRAVVTMLGRARALSPHHWRKLRSIELDESSLDRIQRLHKFRTRFIDFSNLTDIPVFD